MTDPSVHESSKLRLAQGLAVFMLYVTAGKLGLMLATDNPSVTPVWAPTGIAVAALLLQGRWLWPAVFLGAFIVNVTTAGGFATSLAIATGNTLEAVLAVTLVRRFAGGRRVFTEPQNIFAFALHAGILATMVSATIGVGSLRLAGLIAPARMFPAWMTWWLGDGAGALLVAPLFVLWTEPYRTTWGPRRLLEVAGLCFVIIAVSGLVFAGVLPAGLGFTGTSLLVWAAFRFGQRVTATATVLLAAISVWGTVHGHGPFARGDVNESLLMLQTYMAVIAVTSLAMSATVRQRRAAAHQVAQLAGHLEAEVGSRTRELARANEQLREQIRERRRIERERETLLFEQAARLEAERANQQKDEFLATLSHELRTPLNAIVGWAQLLQHGHLDVPTRKKAIDAIERNARIQTRLISDILDISRITAGKFELRLQRVDPMMLVESAIELVRPQAQEKGLHLHVIGEVSSTLVGDPERLVQAICNVVSNAVKFTPEGGHIDLALRNAPSHLEIEVADTGPGIAPAFLPDIFERFKQHDASSTREHGGLGLGLSIARHILTLHGGDIVASNRPVGGAVFTLTIPRSAPSGLQGAPDVAPAFGARVLTAPVLEGRRVLVVDDQESARDLAAAVLSGCGAAVVTAPSSREALDRLRELPFDVIVADLSMPGEDGYEFLSRARAATTGAGEIPAIALTALASPEEEERARAAGFQRFIVKPANPAQLVSAVAALAASPNGGSPQPSRDGAAPEA